MASNPKEPHVCGAAGYGAIGDICPACVDDRAASPLPAEPPPTLDRVLRELEDELRDRADNERYEMHDAPHNSAGEGMAIGAFDAYRAAADLIAEKRIGLPTIPSAAEPQKEE